MKLRPGVPPTRRNADITALADVIAQPSVTTYQELPPAFQRIIQRAWARQGRTALAVRPAAIKAGVGVSTLWRDLKLGLFVPPIKISPRRTAFLDVEIDALLEAKTLLSRSGLKIDLRVFIAALIDSSHDSGCHEKQR